MSHDIARFEERIIRKQIFPFYKFAAESNYSKPKQHSKTDRIYQNCVACNGKKEERESSLNRVHCQSCEKEWSDFIKRNFPNHEKNRTLHRVMNELSTGRAKL